MKEGSDDQEGVAQWKMAEEQRWSGKCIHMRGGAEESGLVHDIVAPVRRTYVCTHVHRRSGDK